MPASDLTVEFINPANDARWDRFVIGHPFGWIPHLSCWQRILEQSFSHMKGYYLALVQRQGGEIKAALPLFEVRSWLTGTRLVSIPWATLCDPLVSCVDEYRLLRNKALDMQKTLDAGHLEVRSLHSAALLEDGIPAVGPVFKHHYLSLDRDPEELRRTFHRSCVQQRISRAYASNLRVRTGDSTDDLDILYAMHLKNRKHKSLPPHPYLFFRNLWEILAAEKLATMLIAEFRGKPVATLLLFTFNGRMSAEVAQIDEDYRNMSPNILLFWEAIKQGVRDNYRIFDFGRTSPERGSLLEFKSRGGTKVADFRYFYYPAEEGLALVDNFSKRYSLLQFVCKHTPELVQPYIGEFCYRHCE
jgi:hypothetical protein